MKDNLLYYTVPEAAKKLKRGVTQTYSHVAELGLGLRTVGGTPILTSDDLESLKAHKPKRGRKPKTV